MSAKPAMRHRLPAVLLMLAACLALVLAASRPVRSVAEVESAIAPMATPDAVPDPIATDVFVGPDAPFVIESEHAIERGDTITGILSSLGLPAADLLSAAKMAGLDLGHIRTGRALTSWRKLDATRPFLVAYPLDEDGDRRIIVQDLGADGWYAFSEAAAYETRPTVRSFTVTSSLWEQATDAGFRPGDIQAIAKVFEYEIDFNTEVHPGMTVEVVTEELYENGALKKLGAIEAARLTNPSGGGKSKEYVAIRYTTKDDVVGYYAPDGKARKKAFLRSPLEFSRVTSGFTKSRYHPILKKSRAHNGVDLGAPSGTPVRAVADGVVAFAGNAGGHGNHVKLDHEGPYETGYSHLSKILVHKGEHVHQGELVGLVGSTGLATGPHLHYEFFLHGKYVDPMKVDLPLTEELAAAELPAFFAVRDAMLARLSGEAVSSQQSAVTP